MLITSAFRASTPSEGFGFFLRIARGGRSINASLRERLKTSSQVFPSDCYFFQCDRLAMVGWQVFGERAGVLPCLSGPLMA